MKTKVFTKNKQGKIEFTERELKNLLDEIYDEGYNDGSKKYYYTTPYHYNWPTWYSTTTTPLSYTTTAASSNITCNNDSGITITTSDITPNTISVNCGDNEEKKTTYKYTVKRDK